MDKNSKFLKGPYCKIQTPIRWIFCGKPGKRLFYKMKTSFKLALKKGKRKDFKVYKKKKITKKAVPARDVKIPIVTKVIQQ